MVYRSAFWLLIYVRASMNGNCNCQSCSDNPFEWISSVPVQGCWTASLLRARNNFSSTNIIRFES